MNVDMTNPFDGMEIGMLEVDTPEVVAFPLVCSIPAIKEVMNTNKATKIPRISINIFRSKVIELGIRLRITNLVPLQQIGPEALNTLVFMKICLIAYENVHCYLRFRTGGNFGVLFNRK